MTRHPDVAQAFSVGAATAAAALVASRSFAGGEAAPEPPWQRAQHLLRPLLLGAVSGTVAARTLRRVVRGVERAEERAVARAVAETREEQRQIIHGSVLQTLESLCAPDAHARLDLLRRQARRDVRQLRAYLAGLNPVADDGMECMLERLVEEGGDRGLLVEVVREDAPGASYALEPRVLSALYLAAGEALVNVAKHAGVGHATLRLAVAGGGLVLSIADVGCGFDPEALVNRRGFGLRRAIAAVNSVGGSADVDGQPGAGTLVWLWVPFAGDDRGEGGRSPTGGRSRQGGSRPPIEGGG